MSGVAETRAIGVGLLGLGVVGGGVAQRLHDRAEAYARTVGRPLALRRVLVRDLAKARSVALDAALLTKEPDDIFDDPDIHVIIEVMGGEELAYPLLRRALESGRYVVTANKEVMAKHGPELLAIARARGVDILYEASVGGGIPLIAPLKRDLLANEITSLQAIINGTTNYILTRMAREGADYAVALRAAQELGYAEADPRSDVEGIDAAYKLAIMASLAFRIRVHPDQVSHEGITRLTGRDFRYASALGYAIKLLAIGRRDDHAIDVRVHPALVPLDAPLAKVDGVYNAVQLEGDLTGAVFFQGRGAGALPTTSAVVADLLNVAHGIAQGAPERFVWREDPAGTIKPMAEVRTRYYLRLRVADQAGVLAQITRVMGEQYAISIASLVQQEAHADDQTAEIVIMTHLAREADMRAACEAVGRLPVVTEVGAFLRVEGSVEA